jgi:hypothetical protein
MSEETKAAGSETAAVGPAAKYEEDAIYQDGKIVGRVLGAEVRSANSEIHFDEINDSEILMLPEECEFQKYRLIVKSIEYASRIDKSAPKKGRVLRGVVAEILGYREQ